MKISWGTGIFIAIIIFLIGMISLVIISSMQPLNMVSPDYYPKGIDYQQQIDKESRAKALQEGIKMSQDANNIYVGFPVMSSNTKPVGMLLVYRPADNRYDKEFDIEVNDSLYQIIPKSGLFKGRCIIKIDWHIDSTTYFVEESMMLY